MYQIIFLSFAHKQWKSVCIGQEWIETSLKSKFTFMELSVEQALVEKWWLSRNLDFTTWSTTRLKVSWNDKKG